jgi:hypothetical protein
MGCISLPAAKDIFIKDNDQIFFLKEFGILIKEILKRKTGYARKNLLFTCQTITSVIK